MKKSGKLNVRFNAERFYSGSVVVYAACQDNKNKLHRWEAEYKDFHDVKLSSTGLDGIRDDQAYVDLAGLQPLLETLCTGCLQENHEQHCRI